MDLMCEWQSIRAIWSQMKDYLPEGISVTTKIDEADVFLVYVISSNIARIYLPAGNNQPRVRLQSGLNNLTKESKIHRILDEKPRILFFNSLGQGRAASLFPDWVKDTDIPTGPSPLPVEHPNARVVCFIDDKRFYVSDHAGAREVGSCVVMRDHLKEGRTLASLLEKGVIQKMYVAGLNKKSLDLYMQQNASALLAFRDKVEAVSLQWSDEVRDFLNRVEFVLSLRPKHGMELLGPEGAFCGAQPIYPDNTYYRSCYGDDDLGVKYYRINDIETSLTEIFKEGYNWMDHHKGFCKALSAKENLPAFWQHVRNVVRNKL